VQVPGTPSGMSSFALVHCHVYCCYVVAYQHIEWGGAALGLHQHSRKSCHDIING
jgi:hypothetical protein